MSIMSDPGRPAGTNSPCPVWCDLPGDHDMPAAPVLSGEAARREHAVILLDDDRFGYVAATRTDDVLCPDGPELPGPLLVRVDDVPSPMPRDRFIAFVDALVRAQGAVAELDAGDARPWPPAPIVAQQRGIPAGPPWLSEAARACSGCRAADGRLVSVLDDDGLGQRVCGACLDTLLAESDQAGADVTVLVARRGEHR